MSHPDRHPYLDPPRRQRCEARATSPAISWGVVGWIAVGFFIGFLGFALLSMVLTCSAVGWAVEALEVSR